MTGEEQDEDEVEVDDRWMGTVRVEQENRERMTAFCFVMLRMNIHFYFEHVLSPAILSPRLGSMSMFHEYIFESSCVPLTPCSSRDVQK